jgi:putative xylitol transport system ATP-binding protein
VTFRSSREALGAGISIIELELSPGPAMSVAENIFLGREPLAGFGRIDFPSMTTGAVARTIALIRAAGLARWRGLSAT